MHNFSPLLQLAPQLFYQLYTIHRYLCGWLLPLVYCSISGKSEDIDSEVFDVVLQYLSQRPKLVTIDFEKVVENVVKQKLPITTISFCFFFHFKKALWKQIQVSTDRFDHKNYDARNSYWYFSLIF